MASHPARAIRFAQRQAPVREITVLLAPGYQETTHGAILEHTQATVQCQIRMPESLENGAVVPSHARRPRPLLASSAHCA
jgi:hypothetical protein